MRTKARAWLVDVLADAMVQANKKTRLEVKISGRDIETALATHRRQLGRKAS